MLRKVRAKRPSAGYHSKGVQLIALGYLLVCALQQVPDLFELLATDVALILLFPHPSIVAEAKDRERVLRPKPEVTPLV